MNFSLPSGWLRSPLARIVETVQGFSDEISLKWKAFQQKYDNSPAAREQRKNETYNAYRRALDAPVNKPDEAIRHYKNAFALMSQADRKTIFSPVGLLARWALPRAGGDDAQFFGKLTHIPAVAPL